jgi:hypothetical protein
VQAFALANDGLRLQRWPIPTSSLLLVSVITRESWCCCYELPKAHWQMQRLRSSRYHRQTCLACDSVSLCWRLSGIEKSLS